MMTASRDTLPHAGIDGRIRLPRAAAALDYTENYLRSLLGDSLRPPHKRRYPDHIHASLPRGFYKRSNRWYISARALREHLASESRST